MNASVTAPAVPSGSEEPDEVPTPAPNTLDRALGQSRSRFPGRPRRDHARDTAGHVRTSDPATFSATLVGSRIVVDSGAGLPEMQYWAKGSHIGSGLGSTNTHVDYVVADGVVKVTLAPPTLTH